MLRLATSSRIMSPFLHQRQRAADRGFRRDVQHDGAERRAAHPRIRNPHHVLDAGARQLHRDRQIAGLRHARRALRAGIAQHQHVVGRDIERGIVDPQRHVLDGIEHHGAAGMLQQLRARRRMLDDRAARRQIAVQHRHRAFRLDRAGARPDRILARDFLRAGDDIAQRLAGDGFGVEIDQIAELLPSVSARRRHDGNAPCNARPTVSGRSAPALRGQACRRPRDRCDAWCGWRSRSDGSARWSSRRSPAARSAHCGTRPRQQLARPRPLGDRHRGGDLAAGLRQAKTLGMRRRDGRAHRQRQAHRFGDAGHGARPCPSPCRCRPTARAGR